jgi:hypothetical protein
MSLLDLQLQLGTRIGTLEDILAADTSEYVRGNIAGLAWCKDQIDDLLDLPRHLDKETVDKLEEEEEEEEVLTNLPGTPSLGMASHYSTSPCQGEKQHAYELQQPYEGYKRCKHCGDVQAMTHGDKIRFGKRVRKTARQEGWAVQAVVSKP